jgi:hypothetical protein
MVSTAKDSFSVSHSISLLAIVEIDDNIIMYPAEIGCAIFTAGAGVARSV